MYAGGMGGGGNAWMKIMGIDGDKVGKRQVAKEKDAKDAKKSLKDGGVMVDKDGKDISKEALADDAR
jgi:hypothetical protein